MEAARPDPRHRHHRLGQVDHARRDDRLHQHATDLPHRHDRGPDRVPDPRQALDREPARDRRRHDRLRAGACAPRCARTRTSSWSAKCATSRPSRPRSRRPRPATWCMSTLHTVDATETITRIVSVFPPHQQPAVRLQLAPIIKGASSASGSCRAPIGKGRVPAVEILVAPARVRECIADAEMTKELNDDRQVASLTYGMQSFGPVAHAPREGAASWTYEEALLHVSNPDDFALRLGRDLPAPPTALGRLRQGSRGLRQGEISLTEESDDDLKIDRFLPVPAARRVIRTHSWLTRRRAEGEHLLLTPRVPCTTRRHPCGGSSGFWFSSRCRRAPSWSAEARRDVRGRARRAAPQTYEIPITVPPGAAGMEPAISLAVRQPRAERPRSGSASRCAGRRGDQAPPVGPGTRRRDPRRPVSTAATGSAPRRCSGSSRSRGTYGMPGSGDAAPSARVRARARARQFRRSRRDPDAGPREFGVFGRGRLHSAPTARPTTRAHRGAGLAARLAVELARVEDRSGGAMLYRYDEDATRAASTSSRASTTPRTPAVGPAASGLGAASSGTTIDRIPSRAASPAFDASAARRLAALETWFGEERVRSTASATK